MHSSISNSKTNERLGTRDAIIAFLTTCAVVFLVLGGLTEWLIRQHVLPQDTRAAHLRLFNEADASSAAFGDSRAARGFNATDGFINLAFPSENIHDISAKVKNYFRERDPKWVILQADPHMFAPYRVHAARNTQKTPEPFLLFSERHRSRILSYWEAYIRAGGHLVSKVQMTDNGSLLSEGDLSQVPPRKRILEARVRSGWHQIEETEAVARAREDYAAMLDWLVARDVGLCLVSFPVSDDYARAVRAAGHEMQIAFFKREAARVAVPYVDARDAISERSFFRDVDHLNQLGAIEFSPRLLEECFGAGEQH